MEKLAFIKSFDKLDIARSKAITKIKLFLTVNVKKCKLWGPPKSFMFTFSQRANKVSESTIEEKSKVTRCSETK